MREPIVGVFSTVVAGLLVLAGTAPVANAAGIFTDGYLNYTIINDTELSVTGFTEPPTGPSALTLPTTVNDGETFLPVTDVADGAFRGQGLTSVAFGDELWAIGNDAFRQNSLTSVVIPDSVAVIGTQSFAGNPVSSLVLGSAVELIGSGAFEDAMLESLVIPASVTEIEGLAFGLVPNTTVRMLGNAPEVWEAASPVPSFPQTARIIFPVGATGYETPTWQGYSSASYTVLTFDANGHGTAPEPQVVVDGDTTVEPDAPTANGYRFTGWYTDPQATTPFSFEGALPSNTTVYAGWVSTAATVSPASQQLAGTVGQEVTPTIPLQTTNIAGGVTYTIEPELPEGLSLSAQTGVVSGTPTQEASGTYTITATGGASGSAQAQLVLSISRPAAPSAPLTVVATPLGGQAVVSWLPGDDATGVEYIVRNTDAPLAVCFTQKTWCYIPGLTVGQSYTFEVSARTQYSPQSAVAVSPMITIPAVEATPADDVPSTSSPGLSLQATDAATGATVTEVTPGMSLVLTGQGYVPNSTLYLYLYSTPQQLASITVNALGGFTQTITVPATAASGAHRLVAQGFTSQGALAFGIAPIAVSTAASPVSSPASASSSAARLASTGGTLPWGVVGIAGLALVGGIAVRVRARAEGSSRQHRRDM